MPLGAFRTALMGIAGSGGDNVKLLDTQDATSDVTSIEFTSKINATYKEYVWVWYDVNPTTDGAHFEFQMDAAGGAYGYDDLNMVSCYGRIYLSGNTSGGFNHLDTHAQGGTANYARLTNSNGNAATESSAGELHVINPSNTSLETIWWANTSTIDVDTRPDAGRPGGHFMANTAMNAIKFKMSSGSFTGKIKMWGYN
tara:strand:+ start:295 stop:888 length:594 start_codon:yes stop_codon:yes gene_type:complete